MQPYKPQGIAWSTYSVALRPVVFCSISDADAFATGVIALGVSAGVGSCPSAKVSFAAGCDAELFAGAGAAAFVARCGPGARAAQLGTLYQL